MTGRPSRETADSGPRSQPGAPRSAPVILRQIGQGYAGRVGADIVPLSCALAPYLPFLVYPPDDLVLSSESSGLASNPTSIQRTCPAHQRPILPKVVRMSRRMTMRVNAWICVVA